jgi:hypothetical protein
MRPIQRRNTRMPGFAKLRHYFCSIGNSFFHDFENGSLALDHGSLAILYETMFAEHDDIPSLAYILGVALRLPASVPLDPSLYEILILRFRERRTEVPIRIHEGSGPALEFAGQYSAVAPCGGKRRLQTAVAAGQLARLREMV